VNLNLEVNMESDVFKALGALMTFKPKDIVKDLSENVRNESEGTATQLDTLKAEALRSYVNTWGGQRLTQEGSAMNGLYRAVKQVLLGHTKRGLLTGSTLEAIKAWSTDDTAFAGIDGGTWPTGSDEISVPMWKIAEKLNLAWRIEKAFEPKEPTEKARKWAERQRTRRRELKRFAKGLPAGEMPVVMKWGGGGFSILWPGVAKRILKIKDIGPISEPFNTKKYYRDYQDKMISMSNDFINQALGFVGDQYVRVMRGEESAREPNYQTESGAPASSFEEPTGYAGRSRTVTEAQNQWRTEGVAPEEEQDFVEQRERLKSEQIGQTFQDKMKQVGDRLGPDVTAWLQEIGEAEAEKYINGLLWMRP
jgi:hypothetical protein